MNTAGQPKPQTFISDSRLNPTPNQTAEIAENLLRRDGRLFYATLSCEFHKGVLTLRGCLSSYYLKQWAQTVVARVEGVSQIDNRIEVVAPTTPMHRTPK